MKANMKYLRSNQAKTIEKQDYSKSIIFDTQEFKQKGHLLQTVTIPPETKQREHYHKKQTEVFYILKGECSIFINDMEFPATPGDAFICEPGDKHYLHNKSKEPFKLLVFKIDYPQDGEDTIWNN